MGDRGSHACRASGAQHPPASGDTQAAAGKVVSRSQIGRLPPAGRRGSSAHNRHLRTRLVRAPTDQGVGTGFEQRRVVDPAPSFDCSGLVQWSFAQAGIFMPRVAADQARTGPAVPVKDLLWATCSSITPTRRPPATSPTSPSIWAMAG